jgi:hypothetical protein
VCGCVGEWVLTNHLLCWIIILQELERDLQDNPLFTITFTNTAADETVTPNDILSTFTHADVTNVEGDGAVYGSLQVKYFNVVDQTCYNAAGDDGTTCTCSTSNEVSSGGAPITPALATADSGTPTDNTVTTVVRDELAPLLNSDAKTIVGDKAYVAYCVRFSLLTNDATPLVANSQDVLVFFTGTNDPNASFDVNGEAEADDNENPTPDDFTVTARLCSGTLGLTGTPLPEGAPVNICIDSNDDPAARIVAITSWTWTIGTTTQAAINNSAASNALTTLGTCTAANLGATPPVKSKCDFTTTFGTAIYDTIGAGADGNVLGVGTVNLAFNGEARVRRARVLFLKSGDNFAAPASMELAVAGPQEDGWCDCFFMNIFCWISQCLLGFLFL